MTEYTAHISTPAPIVPEEFTISVVRLNEYLRKYPEFIRELLLRRIPAPAEIASDVTTREDGLCSALSLFNNAILSKRLIALYCAELGGAEGAEDPRGFEILADSTSKTAVPGRTFHDGQEPCYVMTQRLFNLMWDTFAKYASEEELAEINAVAAECHDAVPGDLHRPAR